MGKVAPASSNKAKVPNGVLACYGVPLLLVKVAIFGYGWRLDKGQNRHGDASQDRSSVNTYTHTVRERERESDPMYPSSSSWLNESCCVGPIRTLYGGGCHTIIGSYVATICKEVRREKLKRESGGLYTHTQASAIVRRRCNLRINV